MTRLELKPCPFCGKDAQVAPDEIGSGGQHVSPYHAGCLRGAGCGIAFTADDPDEAIAEWNRRALSTVTPAEVGGLVDTLRSMSHDDNTRVCVSVNITVSNDLAKKLFDVLHAAPKAATALEGQAAELAMWREVKHSSPRLEIIEAELTAERAAHAETRRERDEHKRLKNELVLKAYRAMDGADDLAEALERYGFPVSDAAEPALMGGGSREAQVLHKAAKAFIAARRALEGGK